MKKKNNIAILSLIVSFSIVFGLMLIFMPFNTKKLKGEIVPANPAFNDMNFYSCVVQSYFSETSEEGINMFDYYDTYDGYLNMDSSTFNEYLSDEQLSKITNLSCDSLAVSGDINSVKGIEKLSSLELIEFSYTGDDLDFSSNPNLQSLSIQADNISNINLKNNGKLTKLEIRSYISGRKNLLKTIDLTKNTLLTNLTISNVGLESIDLSKNTALTDLDLTNNFISSIDISNTATLRSLTVSNNKLTSLDLTNTNISASWNMNYEYNDLSSIKFSSTQTSYNLENQSKGFKNIDYGNGEKIALKSNDYIIDGRNIIIKGEPDITEFINNLVLTGLTAKICTNSSYRCTEVTSGNIIDGYYLKFNEDPNIGFYIKEFNSSTFDDYKLYSAVIDGFNSSNSSKYYTAKNNLTDEELATIKGIRYSTYNINEKYPTKGLEKLTGLTSLDIGYIDETFDFSKFPNLTSLTLFYCSNETINLSSNPLLTNIKINQCPNLTTIKGTDKLTNLTNVSITTTKLTAFDVSNSANLTSLELNYNELESLDITKNTELVKLAVSGSKLQSLDLSKNSKLTYLELYENKLKKLDFTNNPLINSSSNYSSEIDLSNNELTEIKGLNNISATELILDNNNLTELDLTGNTTIEKISAINNNISKVIDLDQLTNLQSVFLYGNPVSKDTVHVIAGTSVNYVGKIKFPEYFVQDTYNEDDSIATISNNVITGIRSGQTVAAQFSLFDSGYMPISLPFRTYIKVYDITSKKYAINKDKKYIYVGTEDNDKAINRYIKVSGPDVKKKIANNKFKVLDDNDEVETYDLIKISSDKYNLNKSEIAYTGNFDLNAIIVTNGTKAVVNNELQILYDDVIVKTFTLKEEK